jgi:hypothetical protein
MSAPHPLNQAVIAQALYDLRNGQLRRCKADGVSARKSWTRSSIPRMVSVLANANVSWCSVSVNREVLRRLLSQAQDVEKEIATVDRMLRLGASTEMVSRFYGLTHQEVALRRGMLGLPKRKGRHPVLDEKQDVGAVAALESRDRQQECGLWRTRPRFSTPPWTWPKACRMPLSVVWAAIKSVGRSGIGLSHGRGRHCTTPWPRRAR